MTCSAACAPHWLHLWDVHASVPVLAADTIPIKQSFNCLVCMCLHSPNNDEARVFDLASARILLEYWKLSKRAQGMSWVWWFC